MEEEGEEDGDSEDEDEDQVTETGSAQSERGKQPVFHHEIYNRLVHLMSSQGAYSKYISPNSPTPKDALTLSQPTSRQTMVSVPWTSHLSTQASVTGVPLELTEPQSSPCGLSPPNQPQPTPLAICSSTGG